MKLIKLTILLAVILLATVGCRDAKNEQEQEQVEQAIQSIDSVETAINESSKNVEDVANETESALKELDSI